MKAKRFRQVLEGVLLAGAPLLLGDCVLGQTSCPEGVPPPLGESRAVEATLADGGPLSAAQCEEACKAEHHMGVITCVREAPESVLCIARPFPCEGRRPVGLRVTGEREPNGFDAHLADAAWLEAASVDAFRALRRELRAHGAPRRLLRAASRSARDERRHARATRALARCFGVRVAPVERDASAPLSLEALARDNAAEGCVRETWGALIALRQASRASEPSVRAALARIARDEVRHAEFSWQIERWLSPRLTPEARTRVREARRAAFDQLAAELRFELPRPERERLGLPGTHEAAELLEALDRALSLTS